MPLPTRMTFRTLPDHLLPHSEAIGTWSLEVERRVGLDFVQEVVDRWRRAATDRKPRQEEVPAPATAPDPSALQSASARLDQAKYQLLRR